MHSDGRLFWLDGMCVGATGEWMSLQRMDAEAAETVAGVVRLLGRYEATYIALAEAVGSPRTERLDQEGPVIRELENSDGRDPWGLTALDDVTQYGPTDRALRWVAHLYRYGLAVSYNPTKAVGESLKLPRSTAGRWIAAARSVGHLGPSEGVGKAGG